MCEPKEGGRATGCDPKPYNISTTQPHSIAHHNCCSSYVVQTQQVVLFWFVLFCSALKGFFLFFACMYILFNHLNLTSLGSCPFLSAFCPPQLYKGVLFPFRFLVSVLWKEGHSIFSIMSLSWLCTNRKQSWSAEVLTFRRPILRIYLRWVV